MLFLTYDQLSWEFEEAPEHGEDFYSSLWLEFDSVLESHGNEEKVTKRVQIFSRQVTQSFLHVCLIFLAHMFNTIADASSYTCA